MRKIKCELVKTCYLPMLLFSAFGAAFGCLLSSCYSDASLMKEFTVLELLVNADAVPFEWQPELCGLQIWEKGLGMWTNLIFPLLVSISYLYVLSAERQSGAVRQVLLREGNFSYCFSKLASAAVLGGLVLLIGYALYGLLVWAAFPSLGNYPDELCRLYMEQYYPDGAAVFIIQRLAGVMLYGMFLSVFGIGVSLFFTDPYILLCLPMMLYYAYTQLIGKLQSDAWTNNDDLFAGRMEAFKMSNLISFHNPGWKETLFFMAACYLILFFVFCCLMKKRRDSSVWV